VNVCFCSVRFNVPIPSKRLAWGMSPKWLILCRVGRKTATQSVSQLTMLLKVCTVWMCCVSVIAAKVNKRKRTGSLWWWCMINKVYLLEFIVNYLICMSDVLASVEKLYHYVQLSPCYWMCYSCSSESESLRELIIFMKFVYFLWI